MKDKLLKILLSKITDVETDMITLSTTHLVTNREHKLAILGAKLGVLQGVFSLVKAMEES